MKTSQTGTALVQLLVVIAVIGIAAIVTFPRLSEYTNDLELKNSTKALLANLKLAQQKTVTEQVKYAIRLTPLGGGYFLVKKSDPEEIMASWLLSDNVYFSSITGLVANEAVYNFAGAVDFTGEITLTHAETAKQTLVEIKPSGYVSWQSQ